MKVAVGIDVGGTKIAGALVDADGTIMHRVKIPTARTEAGADPEASGTAAVARELLAQASSLGLEVAAAGVGVPEYVTPAGEIASSEVLDWSRDDLRKICPEVSLVVESDVRCGALGEAACGHGRHSRSMVYVSLGTGISHSLVIDGEIWPGHRGEAIAFGELRVEGASLLFPDAAPSLERQASGRSLEAVARPDRADSGSSSVDEMSRRAGRLVAASLASLVHLMDPEIIVLGGGLGSGRGPYSDAVIDHAEELFSTRPDPPRVRRSMLGPDAGLVGAGLTALRATSQTPMDTVR